MARLWILIRLQYARVDGHFRLRITDADARLQRLAAIPAHKLHTDQRFSKRGTLQRRAATGRRPGSNARTALLSSMPWRLRVPPA